jgi:hypothetical protein
MPVDPFSITIALQAFQYIGMLTYAGTNANKRSTIENKPYPEWLTETIYHIWWFPSAFTSQIDKLIMENPRSRTGQEKLLVTLLPNRGKIPASNSNHYWYQNEFGWKKWFQKYITLYKHTKTGDRGKKTEYYILYIKRNDRNTMSMAEEMCNTIYNSIRGLIYVNSITTVNHLAETITSLIAANPARNYQRMMVNKILENFNSNDPVWNDGRTLRNQTCLLYGPKGSGKTEVGSLLVKELKDTHNKKVRFYNDFNPCDIGVDVNHLVLQHVETSEDYVTVIIINEIDCVFNKATDDKRDIMGGREFQHAKDKPSLNNMLDKFDRTKGLIVLYTTEKKPEEMAYNPSNNYYQASFFRRGRVKSIFKLTSNGDTHNPQFNAEEEEIYDWKERLNDVEILKVQINDRNNLIKKIKESLKKSKENKYLRDNLSNLVQKLINKRIINNGLKKGYNKIWERNNPNKLYLNYDYIFKDLVNYFLNNKHFINTIFILILYMSINLFLRYINTPFISITLIPCAIYCCLLFHKETKKISKINERTLAIQEAESIFDTFKPE